MLNVDQVLNLPIRALDKATRRIKFELSDGMRFDLVGGMDRRPLETGVAAFSPREMLMVLASGLSEEGFKAVARIKKIFGGGIEEVTADTQ